MQSFIVIAQPTQLPEKFSTGQLRYDCRFSCSWGWVSEINNINDLYRKKEWENLAIKLNTIGLETNYSYYGLARAAAGLGYENAARTYLELAKTTKPYMTISGNYHMGCGRGRILDFCKELELILAEPNRDSNSILFSKPLVASDQQYFFDIKLKQEEKIETVQIDIENRNQVINSSAPNISLFKVEQPLLDKSTTPQLNVQTSNAPIQILIDACKALQDLQKKSDCLEMILKMGQSVTQPPITNQVQVKQTTTELENLRLAISSVIVGITSGSQWISIDEKINTALVLKENMSSVIYEGPDEQYKIELLKILDSCEDYKFISSGRRSNYRNDSYFTNVSESSKHYKIGLKYGLKPDEINFKTTFTNHYAWGSVLNAIEKYIDRNLEISTYKWKNKYLSNLSWEEKTKRITDNFMLLVESNPYKDGIKIFKSRIHNVEAEILLRCDSDKDKCNSDEQVKKKVGQDNVFSAFKDVVYIYNRFSDLRDSDSSAFVVYANKYQYPISYGTFLGVRVPKLDKANETEKFINHILNLIKERAKSPASND